MTFQRLDVRFPLRAAEGPMTKDWLLNEPKREEAYSGRHSQPPLHPTGSLAGRFARCLACNCSRGRLDRSLLGWTMASYCDERLSLHRAWPVIGFEGFPMEPKSTAVALAIAARPTRGTVRAAKRRIRSAGHALRVECEA